MSRDSDALANILTALSELESSVLISETTRLKIENLRAYVESEIRSAKELESRPTTGNAATSS